MSNAELAKYKQHLQQYVFAGWAPPDDLKEWVRLFERVLRHVNLGDEDNGNDGAHAGSQGRLQSVTCAMQFCLLQDVTGHMASVDSMASIWQ